MPIIFEFASDEFKLGHLESVQVSGWMVASNMWPLDLRSLIYWKRHTFVAFGTCP